MRFLLNDSAVKKSRLCASESGQVLIELYAILVERLLCQVADSVLPLRPIRIRNRERLKGGFLRMRFAIELATALVLAGFFVSLTVATVLRRIGPGYWANTGSAA